MNLAAYPRTIKDILTLNRKYIIPRFQREYSWEQTEHTMFWEDLCNQIKVVEDNIIYSDYFIGALVLVGDDSKDEKFSVVDGQQRLTTITIIFSALAKCFIDIKEKELAKSCYSYVEGKDGDYKPFFKLINENPRPFLQNEIQYIDFNKDKIIKDLKPKTYEEKKLYNALKFYCKELSEESLSKKFYKQLNKQYDYCTLLKAVRDQLLKFKTIFITVGSMNEAYTIFETLNAKGKDLLTIDLIKNKIFKLLDKEHPDDEAKTLWKKFNNELNKRERRINPSIFLRHYWISRYEFVTEAKIYESFNRKLKEDIESYKEFLIDLVNSSKEYNLLANPLQGDWKLNEDKDIYYSLYALNVFKVQQPRPFILSLLNAKNKRLLTVNEVRDTIKIIEKFHFIFSAVTSSRASGLEGKYSTLSRHLRKAKDKVEAKSILVELERYLKSKIPTKNIFFEGFNKICFLNDKTHDKKLIQYIFFSIERKLHKTDEFIPYNITLEHIYPQSKQSNNKGKIGNILPLSQKINGNVSNKDFFEKISEFKLSELKIVKNFIEKYSSIQLWNDELTNKRTNELAETAYTDIWNF